MDEGIDENILKVIENTREGILTQKVSLPQGIISLHYIAQLLNREGEKNWAENELKSYATDEIPDYRQDVFGHIIVRSNASLSDSLKARGKPIGVDMRIGINAIADFLNSDKKEFVIGLREQNLVKINKNFKTTLEYGEVSIGYTRGALTNLLGSVNLELSKKLGEIEK